MQHNSLTPVPAHLISVGKALPHSIYSAGGELLLSQGFVIESAEQLETLLSGGYFRRTGEDNVRAQADTGGPATKSAEQGAAAEASESQTERVMMDDVRWQVGETFFLHQQGSSARYTARFIGFIKNRTVLVTMPIVDDKYVLIRDGQMFVVRAFSGKKAYAFSAFVVKSVHSPHPYLHLSYPKELGCATIRHRARITVNVIAAVSLDGQQDSTAAMINDMSLGGASASIKHPFGEVGQRGRIKFKINAVGETVFMDICTILRSIIPVENGGGCKHGYEFVDLSTHDRLVLSAYFHQAEVERN
ncbi:PilZ domain-containing protein [Noviherbaspirillum suwonense]|jgi:c-di-GMP-binding flagellar brake protein YcgR|uniref:PilZ domain-containing protein n=1 Tax=Noviherbaspirillum suwonense TaxID=1224511 RepID=A0ABY1PVG5_9BURK|nr:PilZ domain-containing protein [Noviherbaspirillum suwonense]